MKQFGKKAEEQEKEAMRRREGAVAFRMREHRIVSAGGIFTVLFAFFILAMGMEYPASGSNKVLFYVEVCALAAVGILGCVRGLFRGLSVDEMNMCYVNWRGRKKIFSLDDIGYCKVGLSNGRDDIVLYDLLGKRLCKLEFSMKGSGELLQYLLDNQIRIEWKSSPKRSVGMPVTEALLRETAICQEEVSKYTEDLYGRVQALLQDWEKQNKSFGAYWEFGYGEFSGAQLEGKENLWNRRETLPETKEELPEVYECILEAYLKKDNEYVLDRKNEVVCILIPYLVRGYSYQVGERLRLRKMNEDVVLDWVKTQLEQLTQILPKRKYHTEPMVLKHELRKNAGIQPQVEDKADAQKNEKANILDVSDVLQ